FAQRRKKADQNAMIAGSNHGGTLSTAQRRNCRQKTPWTRKRRRKLIGDPSPRRAGRRCREAADEGRHPASIAPHPALRATLSPQAGRGTWGHHRMSFLIQRVRGGALTLAEVPGDVLRIGRGTRASLRSD